ncbi:MAG: sigma-70 family RNA polymerase sigma factor [Rhodanobacteraceae bacterium]|nr:MAG: sigma-70 family RNA polymerase sigma factor [Rhodanobacteraceae bacterium]
MHASSADVTQLLNAWRAGDAAALAQLTERVYAELHRMARRYMRNERQADTLQATALVNEAYLRLADAPAIEWRDRAQFFALAAQVMRRILVDAARARGAHKRGGGARHVDLDETALVSIKEDASVLALNDALTAFAQAAPRQAKVVELRYFGGLSEDEIADALEVSPRTVRRDWDIARAWLLRELDPEQGPSRA